MRKKKNRSSVGAVNFLFERVRAVLIVAVSAGAKHDVQTDEAAHNVEKIFEVRRFRDQKISVAENYRHEPETNRNVSERFSFIHVVQTPDHQTEERNLCGGGKKFNHVVPEA